MIRYLFLVSLVLFAPLVFGQEDSRALKPVIEVGDRWTYRGVNTLGRGTEEYDVVVASVHDNLIQIVCTRKSDGKEFDGTFTDSWGFATSCSGFVSQPPTTFMRFPMRVGDTHSVKYTTQRARESTNRQKAEGTVMVRRWELIEVPAGKFRALKIEVELTITQPDGGRGYRTTTIWYSPEVRRTVRILSTARGGDSSDEQLLSYKLVE